MSKKPLGRLMNTEYRRYCYHCSSGDWVSLRVLVATGQPVYVCRKNECRSATREVAKQEYRGLEGVRQILIIDDEADIREVMAILLSQEGYYPLLAESGEMALEHLRSGDWTPDLIIVDERMPAMNGHEFIAELEQENLRIMPVVVFSASHQVPKLCQDAHAEGCLLKPFEMDDLLSLLKSLLSKKVEQLI